MTNRHEYDPLLRTWIYGGPGTEGFNHNVDGYNFWAGDMARGVVGITLGKEPEDKKIPEEFNQWTDEQKEAYWDECADKNLSPEMKRYLQLGMEARKAGVKVGVI